MYKSLQFLRTFICLIIQCFGDFFKSRGCKNYLTHLNSTNIKWTEEQDPLGDTKEKIKSTKIMTISERNYILSCAVYCWIFSNISKYIRPMPLWKVDRQKESWCKRESEPFELAAFVETDWKIIAFLLFAFNIALIYSWLIAMEKGGERTLFLIIPFQWPRFFFLWNHITPQPALNVGKVPSFKVPLFPSSSPDTFLLG